MKAEDIDLDGLLDAAENATQGEWTNGYDPCHWDTPEVVNEKAAYYVPFYKDAEFIAKAQPKVVAALVREVKRLRGES